MIPDYLKTIKLGYGRGLPGGQACWMTALQSHLGGKWTDRCDCVDSLINRLCITINDLYYDYDELRTEDILEFGLFTPLGTKGNPEDQQRRLFKLLDTETRVWLPTMLKVEEIPEIKDFETLAIARAKILIPNRFGCVFANYLYLASNYYDLDNACANAVSAITIFITEEFGHWRTKLKEYVFPLLKELIEMGPHAPEEPVCKDIPHFQKLVGIS